MYVDPDFLRQVDSAIRFDLQSWRDFFFNGLTWSSYIVVIGVVCEGPEILHETLNMRRSPKLEAKSWIKLVGLIGWILVVVGVAGEGVFEGKLSVADEQIQTFDEILLTDAQRQSAMAIARASESDREAARLRKEAEDEALTVATLEAELVEGQPRSILLEWHKAEIESALRPLSGQKFLVVQCLANSDGRNEEIRAANSLTTTLQNGANWANSLGPSVERSGRCSGTGIFVWVSTDAPEATRNNARALFAVLQRALGTGIVFDERRASELNATVEREVNLPISFDAKAILIMVGEHPTPPAPPHIVEKPH